MQMKNMKKLLLFVALLFVGGMVAQAQISTGESTASVFKTGNRAEKRERMGDRRQGESGRDKPHSRHKA